MDIKELSFIIIELSLLFSPIFAFFVIYKKRNKKLILICGFVLILFCLSLVFDLSFKYHYLNFIFFTLLYLSICILIISSKYLKNKILKIFIFIMGGFIILLGYIMSTFGILGLGFVVLDYVPKTKVRINENYVYQINSFGNATTSIGGRTVKIMYSSNKLPLIERTIFSKEFDSRFYSNDSIHVKYDYSNNEFYILTKDSTLFIKKY